MTPALRIKNSIQPADIIAALFFGVDIPLHQQLRISVFDGAGAEPEVGGKLSPGGKSFVRLHRAGLDLRSKITVQLFIQRFSGLRIGDKHMASKIGVFIYS